jgi:hypothetical protein
MGGLGITVNSWADGNKTASPFYSPKFCKAKLQEEVINEGFWAGVLRGSGTRGANGAPDFV